MGDITGMGGTPVTSGRRRSHDYHSIHVFESFIFRRNKVCTHQVLESFVYVAHVESECDGFNIFVESLSRAIHDEQRKVLH